jgi:hypothetical protein
MQVRKLAPLPLVSNYTSSANYTTNKICRTQLRRMWCSMADARSRGFGNLKSQARSWRLEIFRTAETSRALSEISDPLSHARRFSILGDWTFRESLGRDAFQRPDDRSLVDG